MTISQCIPMHTHLTPIEREAGKRSVMGMPSRDRSEHLFEYTLESNGYSNKCSLRSLLGIPMTDLFLASRSIGLNFESDIMGTNGFTTAGNSFAKIAPTPIAGSAVTAQCLFCCRANNHASLLCMRAVCLTCMTQPDAAARTLIFTTLQYIALHCTLRRGFRAPALTRSSRSRHRVCF